MVFVHICVQFPLAVKHSLTSERIKCSDNVPFPSSVELRTVTIFLARAPAFVYGARVVIVTTTFRISLLRVNVLSNISIDVACTCIWLCCCWQISHMQFFSSQTKFNQVSLFGVCF